MMDQEAALGRLRQITRGIDDDDVDEGWWETSAGVEFGATRLAELEDLIRNLTTEKERPDA